MLAKHKHMLNIGRITRCRLNCRQIHAFKYSLLFSYLSHSHISPPALQKWKVKTVRVLQHCRHHQLCMMHEVRKFFCLFSMFILFWISALLFCICFLHLDLVLLFPFVSMSLLAFYSSGLSWRQLERSITRRLLAAQTVEALIMQDYICRVCLRRCKISEYYAQRGRKELQTALEYFALFSPFIRLRHVRSHFSARQLLVGTVFTTHHEDSFCALSSC